MHRTPSRPVPVNLPLGTLVVLPTPRQTETLSNLSSRDFVSISGLGFDLGLRMVLNCFIFSLVFCCSYLFSYLSICFFQHTLPVRGGGTGWAGWLVGIHKKYHKRTGLEDDRTGLGRAMLVRICWVGI
jgi:hypothetical protein